MKITAEDIFKFLKGKGILFTYTGDKKTVITGFAPLKNLRENAVTWIRSSDAEGAGNIGQYENLLLIAPKDWEDFQRKSGAVIRCKDPKAVFFKILESLFTKQQPASISETATVLSHRIGKNVSIGAHCFIHEDAVIGDHVSIGNHVCIECPAVIGNDTMIHSGVVIGTDGFGDYEEDGIYRKVPHFGGVWIGERVEIGANTCIDRGTMEDTYIGNDVKIDNLCHIAHNVRIEDRGVVIALSLLGGSSVLEEGSYLAPGVMVRNQVRIGRDSLVGMGAVVTKNVESNTVVVGVPAKAIRENR